MNFNKIIFSLSVIIGFLSFFIMIWSCYEIIRLSRWGFLEEVTVLSVGPQQVDGTCKVRLSISNNRGGRVEYDVVQLMPKPPGSTTRYYRLEGNKAFQSKNFDLPLNNIESIRVPLIALLCSSLHFYLMIKIVRQKTRPLFIITICLLLSVYLILNLSKILDIRDYNNMQAINDGRAEV